MRKSILLYIVVLAGLFNVFTYAWFTKDQAFEKERYEKLDKKLNDSITLLNTNLFDANYFSLETNENAQNYFEDKKTGAALDYKKFIPFVQDELMNFNQNPEGNPYTGFDKLTERKFIINKTKVLNHRWIIADFNDGTFWGEVVIKYFINEDKTVDFEVAETVLYPKR
jgi:hypothetical protein